MRTHKQILKNGATESDDIKGTGTVRLWVRGHNGTWPSGVTVVLQELVTGQFEGDTATWEDDPSSENTLSEAGKIFVGLVEGATFRLQASASGVVARIDTFTDKVQIQV